MNTPPTNLTGRSTFVRALLLSAVLPVVYAMQGSWVSNEPTIPHHTLGKLAAGTGILCHWRYKKSKSKSPKPEKGTIRKVYRSLNCICDHTMNVLFDDGTLQLNIPIQWAVRVLPEGDIPQFAYPYDGTWTKHRLANYEDALESPLPMDLLHTVLSYAFYRSEAEVLVLPRLGIPLRDDTLSRYTSCEWDLFENFGPNISCPDGKTITSSVRGGFQTALTRAWAFNPRSRVSAAVTLEAGNHIGYEQFGIVALTTTSKSYLIPKSYIRGLASFKKDKGYSRVPCYYFQTNELLAMADYFQTNEHVQLGTTLQVVVDKASLQFSIKTRNGMLWTKRDPIDLSHIPKGTPLAFAVSIGTGHTQTVRLCTEDELSEL